LVDKDNMNRPLCECGCGNPVNWGRDNKCWNRFVNGHNKPTLGLKGIHRSPETEFKKGEIHNPTGIKYINKQ